MPSNWVHKAREMPREDFRREVEKELTGKETEASELVYFKLYKSQIPVIEQAIETAALMLGSDKSRGYCLEMICADFLAGANLDNGESGHAVVLDDTILPAPARGTKTGLSREPKRESAMNSIRPKAPRLRLDPVSYENLRQQVLRRDGWRCQSCGAMSNLEVHHQEFRSHGGGDLKSNLITLCSICHEANHRR